jgi:ubiquinone/menaquinone biosynthesis C-methylase UbiE
MERRDIGIEHLDGELDDLGVVAGNLRDLRRFNRLFGGVALSSWGVRRLLDGATAATLLDVGTGGADIPVALLAEARRRDLDLDVTAVDGRAEVIEAARLARPGLERISGLRLGVVEAGRLPYPDGAFDVAHASLVVHHLDESAAVRFLAELARVSRVGVVVNDLHRGRLAWLGAWLVGHFLTRNRFTRHDAPLSVRRAYRLAELEGLLERAGLEAVDRRVGPFGHRYAVVAVARHARQ